MQWVKDFYTKQNEWLGVYLTDIEPMHRQRAAQFLSLLSDEEGRGLRLMELGAGGGQTAIAMAMLDDDLQCTTIELLPESVQHARRLAAENFVEPQIQALQADFYTVDLPSDAFDGIAYFDSFGIGEDADQRRLLRRVWHWLDKRCAASRVLVEVGMPAFWAAVARGKTMQIGDICRRYDFDVLGSRLLDYWYPLGREEQARHQSLRCYTPSDLRLLLEGTGLRLIDCLPNGRVDYERMEFVADGVPLADCMTYYAVLEADF